MPTGSSIQLVRLFGIRIGVSASWFIVLFLFIFLLSDSFRNVLGGSDTQAYTVAVIAALLFFVSLILHELGHALDRPPQRHRGRRASTCGSSAGSRR